MGANKDTINQTKYIFVTGGVLSSLGKGITSASLGCLLKQSGFKVSILKIDPYINVDAGTMSPLEHGEVFVTADGAETDLDIGHYERFLNQTLSCKNNFTTGQVYKDVISKERAGKYLGKTVQVVPHIVDEIKHKINNASDDNDFLIVELGGTVGDIEGLPFLEAIRQFKYEKQDLVLNLHVTLIPYIKVASEFKTKPTQHSIGELRKIGINADILICRSEEALSDGIKNKLSYSTNIPKDFIMTAKDAKSIYQVPNNLLEEGILDAISKYFKIDSITTNLQDWDKLTNNIINPTKEVNLALVGKYMHSKEAYKSLSEAIIHGGAHIDAKININWIDSEEITSDNVEQILKDNDCILVAGGFGERGVRGKIEAIKYARESNKVFLGICLGMQLCVIETLQNKAGIKDANSSEFSNAPSKEDAVYLIEHFLDANGMKQVRTQKTELGATMRLGEYEFEPKSGSLIESVFKGTKCSGRHRHRYEVNSKYEDVLEQNGMVISAKHNSLVECVEIPNHPWFVGVQFHPEFTSSLKEPNCVILKFLQAGLQSKK